MPRSRSNDPKRLDDEHEPQQGPGPLPGSPQAVGERLKDSSTSSFDHRNQPSEFRQGLRDQVFNKGEFKKGILKKVVKAFVGGGA